MDEDALGMEADLGPGYIVLDGTHRSLIDFSECSFYKAFCRHPASCR